MDILQKSSKLLLRVRENRPLIHHITNYVTINDCANIVLALGGSPIMAYKKSEVEEIVAQSSALVLNTGNVNNIEAMILAGKKANELNIPVILDPVGIGASKLRHNSNNKILNSVKISIVKGNMSEIKFLAGLNVKAKGVDSTADNNGGEQVAKKLAKDLNCIVAITGVKDIVSNGRETCIIRNGHRMLSRVTGTGCMTTSLIGTYSSVTDDYLLASVTGIITMGIAGEKAQTSLKNEEGIGTFRIRLFDSIYNINENTILKEGDVSARQIKY